MEENQSLARNFQLRRGSRQAACAYAAAAARNLRGHKAKTTPCRRQNPNDLHRFHKNQYSDYQMIVPQNPICSSLSSTLESNSGSRAPVKSDFDLPRRRHHPLSSPVFPDDCCSDCDSSSTVVVDGGDAGETGPFGANRSPAAPVLPAISFPAMVVVNRRNPVAHVFKRRSGGGKQKESGSPCV